MTVRWRKRARKRFGYEEVFASRSSVLQRRTGRRHGLHGLLHGLHAFGRSRRNFAGRVNGCFVLGKKDALSLMNREETTSRLTRQGSAEIPLIDAIMARHRVRVCAWSD